MINRLLKTIFILLAVSLTPGKSSAQQTCPWEVDPHDYQYDMSLYLGCRLDLTDLDLDRYTVGAFVGEECRGVGEKFAAQGMEAPVVYLRARSNAADGESLTFRCFDTQTGDIYDAATEIPFVSNEHIGFPTEPFTMQFYNQYAPLAGITVTPDSLSVKRGMTGNLVAALVPDNALPTEIVWSSSDTTVATAAGGVVTAEKIGEAMITASAGGYSVTCAVTVLPPDPTAITLTPASATLLVGETATFTYALEPFDATSAVTWASSDTTVATVADGVVTAIFPGSATVTATTENGISATAEVTVKPIEVTAVTVGSVSGETSLKAGETLALSVTVNPDNATYRSVTWSSSDDTVATVDSEGAVTGVAPGDVTITATAVNGVSGSIDLNVLAPDPTAITLTPNPMILTQGETGVFTFTLDPSMAETTLTWASSDTTVATVADGVVTAVFPGSATVTATTENGISATAEVTVKPIEVTAVTVGSVSGETSLKAGETLALSVTVNPDNATYRSVTWSSSGDTVATVDSEGAVTGVAPGDVTITATAVNGVSGSIELKVLPILVESISITPGSIESQPGSTYQLTATVLPENASDKTLVWSSSNQNVASVSESGLVTVIAVGEAVITAEAADGSGVKATCSVSVVTGIADIIAEGRSLTVYTVDGLLLAKEADKDFISGLSQGTYIIVSDGKAVRFRK